MTDDYLITENQDYFSEPKSSIDSFKDLICWQRARILRIQIEELSKAFPMQEQLRLSDQIIRAARSVSSSIAEGFARYHFTDSFRFYYISRGSISEIIDHLIVALDNGYIDQGKYETLESLSHETAKILNEYINFIPKEINSKNPK